MGEQGKESKRKACARSSRLGILLGIALLLSSCAKTAPPPEIEPDPVLWQMALQECRPAPLPQQFICPAHALERVYDILADFEVDTLTCRRDLKHALDVCTIKITQAESHCDGWMHQWFVWLPIGVAVGALATTMVFVGLE